MNRHAVNLTISIACLIATSLLAMPAAQTDGTGERFRAFAVNIGTPGRAGAGQVEIVVNRWSTDAERERLMTTLIEKGPEKLLDALVSLPRVGYFRTPNSIGYDVHFAYHTQLPDGGERVVMATDRYISFWEAANRPRSIDYPFTVIEMHINGDGKGEGKMSLATKVVADEDKRSILLENYSTQPVMLNDVTRER